MSTIKINWGAKIALLYLGFVGIIALLVVGSMRQSTELVSEDYYHQELKYQTVLDAAQNQAALSAPVAYAFNDNQLVLSFPETFKHKELKGIVKFYSAANSSWDKEMNINTTNGNTTLNIASLKATSYTMKISWQADGKDYYQENKIKIKG